MAGKPFEKGHRKVGGRKAGTPNKLTADVRAAIARLAEGNIERCQSWLDRIAKKDPRGALDLFLRMLEYHVPKQGRVEVAGDKSRPLTVKVLRLTDAG